MNHGPGFGWGLSETSMDFQEFPKLLYKGGDIHAEYVIVHDQEQEEDAEGYEVANLNPESIPADAPKKRGRPAKAQ